ncbi:related to Glia maturation factor, beta [Pseudozyma flocculosa]|uniref:Related to Glia maturation factor, beta n=1 Tax=Pseudozyma flocculosa TaxID=84751 RepID=A0A5C3EVG0_9BASI|nr:related to Glia maturation factor, beta [Pseudozyma flocculosa]
MSTTTTVDIPASVLEETKRFRLSKSSSAGLAALVYKIEKKSLCLVVEDRIEGALEDVLEELPENSPRFLVVSYQLQHRDGRVSYVGHTLIPSSTLPRHPASWAPTTSSNDQSMLYASALSNFSVQVDIAKVIDVRDGELSKQALEERLGA